MNDDEDRIEDSFGDERVDHIFDRTRMAAKNRGEEVPSVEDLLLVALQEDGVRQAFRERGVDTDRLLSDLEYTIRYGRPDGLPAINDSNLSQRILQQIDYLQKRLQRYKQEVADAEEHYEGVSLAAKSIAEWAADSEEIEHPDDLIIRREVFSRAVNHFLSIVPEGEGAEDASEQVSRLGFISDLQKHMEYLKTIEKDDSWLWYKTQIAFGSGININPYRFGMFLIEAADPYIGYLLRRNGLVENDYNPPVTLPPRHVIELANSVYDMAHKAGVAEIRPIHFLPYVLADAYVRKHLNQNPKAHKDIQNLARGVDALVFKRPKGNGDVFRQPTTVSTEALTFLAEFEKCVTGVEVSKIGLVLFQLLTQTGREAYKDAADFPYLVRDAHGRVQPELLGEDAYAILHSMGIPSATLNDWPDTVRREIEPLSEEALEDARRLDVGRKVTDREYAQAMKKHAENLTEAAEAGRYDDIKVRDDHVDSILSILMRKNKRNVLIIGEAGVGKTALAQAVAKRIAEGRVPGRFTGSQVYSVDFGSMNQGAMFRGMFEEQLAMVLDGTAERNREKGGMGETVLFVDELHSAIKAGAAMGTDGAGEHLKQRVTDGSLSIIGATTIEEYYRDIYPNNALRRRFQPYFLSAPDEKLCLEILEVAAKSFEKHHKVKIPAELLKVAYNLSERFIHDEQNPDKAITLLDTACAIAVFANRVEVTKDDLIQELASKTGLSADFLSGRDRNRYSTIDQVLAEGVIGQRHATDGIATALKRSALGLKDERKPQGIFMLLGPSGVGKTQTAKEIARIKCGSDKAILTFNMSQYNYRGGEKKLIEDIAEKVSKRRDAVILFDEIGHAHPDIYNALYQAFDEGVVSTHDGREVTLKQTLIIMTDNMGMQEAQAFIQQQGIANDPASPLWNEVNEIYRDAATRHFGEKSVLLGRIGLGNIYGYRPLSLQASFQIVAREVTRLSAQMEESIDQRVRISKELHEELAQMGYEAAQASGYGGRAVEELVKARITDPLAEKLISIKGSKTIADQYFDDGAGTITIRGIGEKTREIDGIVMAENTIAMRRRPRRPKDRVGAPPVAEAATAEAA